MSSVNRRQFCSGLAALSTIYAAKGLAQSTTKKKPNIIFVLCDDLGWGDLKCYNSFSAIPTPNANRLADQGVRWTDMHSSDAVCTPSRYSILTGRYCWRSILKKGALRGSSPSLIEPGRMTVASMLKAEGYYTAGVGKWHLGLGNDKVTDYTKPLHPGPNDFGFDYFFGIPASLDMPPYLYFENDHVVEQPTSSTPGSADKTPHGVFWRPGPMAPHFDLQQVLPNTVKKAVEIINQRATTPAHPFFLYLALPSPHTPWLPLPQNVGRSAAGKYGDYVTEVDDMLGLVMQALDKTGLADNTLIIFTSDNGAPWTEEDKASYEHLANGDWRGQKADIWEGGHRIPFIARWPKHIPPASTSSQLGCLSDFMATAAAITGVKLPPNAAEDSFNLLPVLVEQSKVPARDSLVDHAWDGMFCIQQGNWKLEEGLGSGGWNSRPERITPVAGGPKGQLYDLSVDPCEKHNLYQQNPEIVDRLSKLLETYKRQGYSRPM
ncbi:MAG: arylsulfatase [Nitrosospira sp.]